MSTLLEYVSPKGTTWNLRTGPVRMAPGAQGLGLIPFLAFTTSRGLRGGRRVTGFAAQPQTLQLPMKLGYPGWSSQSWEQIDAAWWPDVRPNAFGLLRCTASDGSVRSVTVRTSSDGPLQWDQDPADTGMTDFDWTLEADDPWWIGALRSVPFGVTGAATPFYGPAGYGPPFYLAPGNSNGSQTISNPGDTDAWPVWTINGPSPSFVITHADGSTISGAPALAAGERLVIDTTEDKKSATRYTADGTASDFTPSLTSWGWRPIPAGTSRSITVAIAGTGGATAEFRPRYFRPFH